jgi:predicted PurR-regulated permease PerM
VGRLKGVALDMVITATLLYVGLSLVGLDYAFLFAVLSALLVVVPYFGAIAGGVPPVLLAFTESPQLGVAVFVVYVVVQQIEGNVIVPLVMARVVKLHPAVIAIGVVVVSQLFGLVGLIVAVPLISAAVILTEELWIHPMERKRSAFGQPEIARAPGGRFSAEA